MPSTSCTRGVMTAQDLLTLVAPLRESWRSPDEKGDDCGRFDSSIASTRTTSPTGSSSADTVEASLATVATGLHIVSTSPKLGSGTCVGDASQRIPDASQRVPACREASERVPDASQRSVRVPPSGQRPRPAPLDGLSSSTASTRTASPTGSSSAHTVEASLAPVTTGLQILSTSPKLGSGTCVGDASQRIPDASQRVPARRDASERVPDASQRSVRVLPSVVRPCPAPLDGLSLRSRGILGDASDRTPPSASGLPWSSMVSSAQQAGGASTETALSQRPRLGHQMGGDASERSLTGSSSWSHAMEMNRGIWSTLPVGELATPAASCPDASQRSQALATESPKREVLMAWLSGSGGSVVGVDLAERLTAAAPESYED